MKALLIADDELAITNISQVLETAGYDVIVYKWLLKALDNIEEIAPHLIVVSTKDYPRHWKTLTQFAETAFSGYRPEVVLYTDGTLDEEELKKAEALKVRGWFEAVDVDGLDKLRKILTKEIDIYSGKLVDEEGKPQQDDIAKFALRPPYPDEPEESTKIIRVLLTAVICLQTRLQAFLSAEIQKTLTARLLNLNQTL